MSAQPGHPFALVGPVHPHRGGIAQHTTELARRLDAGGMLTGLATWRSQGPAFMSPRGRYRFAEEHDAPGSRCLLDWRRPGSWIRAGSLLSRRADRLLFVVSDPFQLPALATVARTFRRGRRSTLSEVSIIVHNVLPHSRRRGDVMAARAVMRVADRVIVHSEQEAALATLLGADATVRARLPFHYPMPDDHGDLDGRPTTVHRHLVFFGTVRPYKGLDVLLRALAQTRSRPSLTVIGEFWEPVNAYVRRAEDLGVEDLVTIVDRFATPAEVAETLRAADAVVLPYRSASGSQMPRVAFAHGVPVIASEVADFSEQVRDGVDGLLVPPGDIERLATAIDSLYAEGGAVTLRRSVARPDADAEWSEYLVSLEADG